MAVQLVRRDQLIQQIKFGLRELTSRNGHHEFEELSRHLARARIISNVIPATGPVSAAGDHAAGVAQAPVALPELGLPGRFVDRAQCPYCRSSDLVLG